MHDASLSHAKPMNFVVTADRERAKAFYAQVLGLHIVSEDFFAVVFDLNGTMLRISTVPGHRGAAHTVLGWVVDDIEATVRGLVTQGVHFNRYDGFEQDPLGIWSPPGGTTRIAWFLDPDGNNLSLTQF